MMARLRLMPEAQLQSYRLYLFLNRVGRPLFPWLLQQARLFFQNVDEGARSAHLGVV